jgi:hypothetical protein
VRSSFGAAEGINLPMGVTEEHRLNSNDLWAAEKKGRLAIAPNLQFCNFDN